MISYIVTGAVIMLAGMIVGAALVLAGIKGGNK